MFKIFCIIFLFQKSPTVSFFCDPFQADFQTFSWGTPRRLRRHLGWLWLYVCLGDLVLRKERCQQVRTMGWFFVRKQTSKTQKPEETSAKNMHGNKNKMWQHLHEWSLSIATNTWLFGWGLGSHWIYRPENWESPFLIGDTSSNGCFSIVMLVFGGVYNPCDKRFV